MTTLASLMQEQLPSGGVAVPGGRDFHMEVIDIQTGLVWMSLEVATPEDFENLALGDTLKPVGLGAAAMDMALFKHSPDAQGQPMRQREIDGYRFINVAKSGESVKLPGGMIEIRVNKAHVLGYKAGRKLAVLSLPEGDFIEVVGDRSRDQQLPLPPEATLREIELQQPLIVTLPTPTKTLWHFAGGMRSFQGPVSLPEF